MLHDLIPTKSKFKRCYSVKRSNKRQKQHRQKNGIGALFRTTSTIGIDNSIQFFEDRIDCYLILLESNYREKHEQLMQGYQLNFMMTQQRNHFTYRIRILKIYSYSKSTVQQCVLKKNILQINISMFFSCNITFRESTIIAFATITVSSRIYYICVCIFHEFATYKNCERENGLASKQISGFSGNSPKTL